ncbi:MAG: hypothetical protein ACI8V0_002826, partial [Pseudohongiellaceae bacterium]
FLEGTVVKIPTVAVGEIAFSIELTIAPGDGPVIFNLTAAAEVANPNLIGASSFEGETLSVPSVRIGDTNLQLRLVLSNNSPIQFQLAEFVVVVDGNSNELGTQQFFETNISSQVVDSRCVFCHVDDGISRNTSLVFARSSDTSTAANFDVLSVFANSRGDALDYILNKVSGSVSHGGGTQLAVGSTDYNNLQNLMAGLVNGSGTVASSSDSVSFFTGVEELGPAKTLRRAAIILAGRAPSAVEIAAVEAGGEAVLRSTIRNVMRGDNFHDFLIEGANDRLLVRGTPDQSFLDQGGVFPNFLNTLADLRAEAAAEGFSINSEGLRFLRGVDRGLRESPLELIAHVVENDKPYSEILTADYMMTNPIAAFAMNTTGNFADPEDYGDFQPVTLDRYYARSADTETVYIPELALFRVAEPGSLFYDYPHAGVLNTQSFLYRYPTTATNRNRARSRWTMLHFLDTDIEASAPRTTDAAALADTNNPTLNNQNCTVCHATLDPLAGAFQNYAEEGHFRNAGLDSLDFFYKRDSVKTGYQFGDTWYRDMRAPGLLGETAPSADNSLQWVAQQIVQDPRFARAAVKFWWPSIIGSELLEQPEVQSDANYAAKLMAYDAQTATIQTLTDGFVSGGMNLKDLLVDMAMSPWFRASSVNDGDLDSVEAQAHSLANLSSERLLTPGQLTRKTKSLTGITWNNSFDFSRTKRQSALTDEYQLFYGGIDSADVIDRTREITALMSTVAMVHASQTSCPIVVREFALADGTRALFDGLDSSITPLTEKAEKFIAATTVERSFIQPAVALSLEPGSKKLFISLHGNFCDYDATAMSCLSRTDLYVDQIDIQLPGGSTTSIDANLENIEQLPPCSTYDGDTIGMCGNSTLVFPYSAPVAGEYRISAKLWPRKTGVDHPQTQSMNFTIGAESLGSPLSLVTNGSKQIKQKLVELHSKLHGKNYATTDLEIAMAYELFVESWDELRSLPNASQDYGSLAYGSNHTCSLFRDYEIGVGVSADIIPYTIVTNNNSTSVRATTEMIAYLSQSGADPAYTKRAWATVMTYMLSHYDYLYE